MTIDSIGITGKTGTNVTGSHTAAPTAKTGTASAAAPAGAAKATSATPSDEQVDKAVADLNKAAQEKTPGIEFSIDPDSKRTIVQVVDQSTRQVLQQFPSKEALAIAKSFEEASSQGTLINQTA